MDAIQGLECKTWTNLDEVCLHVCFCVGTLSEMSTHCLSTSLTVWYVGDPATAILFLLMLCCFVVAIVQCVRYTTQGHWLEIAHLRSRSSSCFCNVPQLKWSHLVLLELSEFLSVAFLRIPELVRREGWKTFQGRIVLWMLSNHVKPVKMIKRTALLFLCVMWV